MPPKDKEARKSVSFQGAQPSKKEKPTAALDDSDKRTASAEAPTLVEANAAVEIPSDGASNTVDANSAVESLDNQGFAPPIERHDFRPSGDDGEVLRMDDGDGQERPSRDDVVDIDELAVDDDV